MKDNLGDFRIAVVSTLMLQNAETSVVKATVN